MSQFYYNAKFFYNFLENRNSIRQNCHDLFIYLNETHMVDAMTFILFQKY